MKTGRGVLKRGLSAVSIIVSNRIYSAGHEDSVTETCFSHDGKFVATGDMKGVVKVWNVDTKKEKCAFKVEDLEVSSR